MKSALSVGDYSFMLPKNEELGIVRDLYFTDRITIERKATLEELSANIAQERERFEKELIRARDRKFILLVEQGEYGDIVNHKYNTQLSEKAYVASLLTFSHRYNIQLSFIPKELCGQYIYLNFYYFLKEYL